MEKIAIFGLGTAFEEYYSMLESHYEICAVVDNNKEKWGLKYMNNECQSPEILKNLRVDKIIIVTLAGKYIHDIKQQLVEMGILAEIITINELFSNVQYNSITEPLRYSDELDNKIIIEEGSLISKLHIYFLGDNNTVIINKDVRINGEITCICRGKGCMLEIGDNSTFDNVRVEMAEGGHVIVGKDCMFADGVYLMQMAYHPIYDLKSRRRINTPKNIVIGDHVWIGRKVELLAGFEIGSGSIVGTGSISSSKFEPNCTIGGNPAVVIRKDVTWGRPAVGYGAYDIMK